jgi:hypothetical protein
LGAIWALTHFIGVQASVIWGGLAAAAVGLWKHSVEQRREHRRLLANEKREQYIDFLNVLSARFGLPGAPAEEMSPEEIAELRRWSLRLTMTGSDEVVLAWNRVRLLATADVSGSDGLKIWGSLWLAMRKDCGHLDTKLTRSDLLASMINDIEDHRAVLDQG